MKIPKFILFSLPLPLFFLSSPPGRRGKKGGAGWGEGKGLFSN
jgi:hypothetical protein